MIRCTAFLGGIDIRVPDGVPVVVTGHAVLGGVSVRMRGRRHRKRLHEEP